MPELLKTERRTRLLTAVVGAVLAVSAGCLALFRPGDALATLSYDLPFVVHRASAPDEIRIVYLDAGEGGVVDRSAQAGLLDKLREAGARAVLYDLIFDEEWTDPAVDEAFAAAMRRFRGVNAQGDPTPGARRRPVILACGRDTTTQAGAIVEKLIPPTDRLIEAADDFGLVLFAPDKDRTVRGLATGTLDEPSITWKMAVALGARLDETRRLDPRWLNYAGPPPDPNDRDSVPAFFSCSSNNVLAGPAPGLFRDAIVVIAGKPDTVGTVLGKDLFATPFHRLDRRGTLPLMNGGELHANALANLLRGNWLTRSTPDFDVAFIILAGIIAGAGLARLRPIRGIVFSVASVLLLIMAGVLAVHYAGVWFPWSVVAFLQIPVALVWGAASHAYIERFFRLKLTEEQRKLRAAFARYLSPQMLDRLTAEGFNVNVGGEKMEAAMMFTDIESFTDMCHKVGDPERIVDTLNDYFEHTTGHIFDHDGVVIKFIGDAIFAAWGAPLKDPEAALKAVRAAWKLFVSARFVMDGEELRTRIGLHCGEVLAGNIGSSRHVDYTLIGDAVNLASRLEGLNKILGTCILVSESVHEKLGGEFCTRRVGRFRVKGREDVTVVHEIIGPAGAKEPDWIPIYHAALEAFEANDGATADSQFAAADKRRSLHGDGPSRFFLERLKRGKPLPGGVVEMDEK